MGNTQNIIMSIPSLEYRSTDLKNTSTWLAELRTEGYTVIGNLAESDEVLHARALVWDWLEGLGTGIVRDDPSTWGNEAWPDWPGIKKYGSCKSNGAAHLGATWYLRSLPKLKEVFSKIYETEDLIVSLDGMILWRPRERATREVIARRRNAVVEGWCFNHWPWEAAGTRGRINPRYRDKYRVPVLNQDMIDLL